MGIELFNPNQKMPFDFKKPIKIKISKQECIMVYHYLEHKSKLLNIVDLTEMLLFEKILSILKKLKSRIQSYTSVRQISFSITEAHAVIFLYQHFSGPTDHLTNIEFVNVFSQLHKQV